MLRDKHPANELRELTGAATAVRLLNSFTWQRIHSRYVGKNTSGGCDTGGVSLCSRLLPSMPGPSMLSVTSKTINGPTLVEGANTYVVVDIHDKEIGGSAPRKDYKYAGCANSHCSQDETIASNLLELFGGGIAQSNQLGQPE